MSIEISFDKLYVGDYHEKLPLSALELDENSHIHGKLKFQIGDRYVPIEGFWGIDDSCFNDWIIEFDTLIELFDSVEEATHTVDEYEPGSSAYLFEKLGDNVYLSLINSEANSTTPGWKPFTVNPEWQKVEFDYQDFRQQCLLFKELFFSEVRKATPDIGEKWIEDLFTEHPYWAKYRERYPERF